MQSQGYSMVCVCVPRSDATNRKLLHKEQLQVTVCETLYSTVDAETGDRTTDSAEWWSDVLLVEGHAAKDCHGRVLKQLENIGVEHWIKLDAQFQALGKFDEHGDFTGWKADADIPQHWCIFCTTTDEGSDEKKVRDYGEWVTRQMPWVLFFQMCCLLHQVHLIFKQLVAAVDVFLVVLNLTDNLPSTSFFSCASTWSNSWREFSSDYRKTALRMFPAIGYRVANKLPPRMLKGRWGASLRFLDFVLERSFHTVRDIFDHMFNPARAKADMRAPQANANTPIDEDGEEDSERYFRRMGKWRKATYQVTQSLGFRYLVVPSST